MPNFNLHTGNCLEVLKEFPDNCIDSIVTDPPYGLSFMGKKWDYDVPSVDIWRECLRVLKPGGHLLSFAGTRTQHRMAINIEDAGFEIRDMIAWVYGSGFPKSLDVSKAIDKAAGAEREVIGQQVRKNDRDANSLKMGRVSDVFDITAPATEAARQWEGFGTSLKPALEPITVARKPLIGTVAENVLRHGTGALNIDGCRVQVDPGDANHRAPSRGNSGVNSMSGVGGHNGNLQTAGRWPANITHDGSEEVVGLFPQAKGVVSNGSAARFFYCAKCSKRDRNAGLGDSDNGPQTNGHPTVKPTDLMRYLCRLVTPPGGTVLDPFMGSGSTGKAAMKEGFDFIGIDMDETYVEIAEKRIAHACLPESSKETKKKGAK